MFSYLWHSICSLTHIPSFFFSFIPYTCLSLFFNCLYIYLFIYSSTGIYFYKNYLASMTLIPDFPTQSLLSWNHPNIFLVWCLWLTKLISGNSLKFNKYVLYLLCFKCLCIVSSWYCRSLILATFFPHISHCNYCHIAECHSFRS